VTPRPESPGVTDNCNEGGRGKQSNSRNGAQAADLGPLTCESLELALDGSHAPFEVADFGAQLSEALGKRDGYGLGAERLDD
jgi:hypothetical protein